MLTEPTSRRTSSQARCPRLDALTNSICPVQFRQLHGQLHGTRCAGTYCLMNSRQSETPAFVRLILRLFRTSRSSCTARNRDHTGARRAIARIPRTGGVRDIVGLPGDHSHRWPVLKKRKVTDRNERSASSGREKMPHQHQTVIGPNSATRQQSRGLVTVAQTYLGKRV